jgi:hypothetical protein
MQRAFSRNRTHCHQDLILFRYNSGYFYSINSMFACPLIKDLVAKFGGANPNFEENDFSVQNATFYFSHSEAVLPFLRLLELYRLLKGIQSDSKKIRTDRKTERQKDRKTERQKDRKTEGQKDKKTGKIQSLKKMIFLVKTRHSTLVIRRLFFLFFACRSFIG